jgi:hypothetical protein
MTSSPCFVESVGTGRRLADVRHASTQEFMRLVLEMAAATGTKRMNMRPISLLDDSTERAA